MKQAPAKHAENLYAVLLANADKAEASGQSVFTGKLVDAFKQAGIANSSYSEVRNILLQTGSIEILERGTRSHPSRIALLHPPPPQKDWPESLTADEEGATLALEELQQAVAALQAWREQLKEVNLVEVLRDMELRITKLEKATSKVKRKQV